MIYIVGTDHKIQNNESTADNSKVTEYFEFVRQEIEQKSIFVVAEESSKESAGERCSNGKTELEIVVSELNANREKKVLYLPVDPDRTESNTLGIKRRENILDELKLTLESLTHSKQWEVNALMAPYDCHRERVWLEKIKPFTSQKILFVCGWMHCATFKDLLDENRHESLILKIII